MRLPKPKKIIAQRYFGGLSIFKRKKVKIKLSANESALGPSPKAIKEYNKVSKNFKRYPDTNGTSLREVIANKFNIDKNRIILGSGSDQIFEFVCNAFIKKNDEVIKINDSEYIVSSVIEKEKFEEFFEISLNCPEVESLGGFILKEFGHLPKVGESIQVENLELIVTSADQRKIKKITVRKID